MSRNFNIQLLISAYPESLVPQNNTNAGIIVFNLAGNIADQSPLIQNNTTRMIRSGLHTVISILVVTGQDGTKQTFKIIKN